jgi:ankyrin repeat protein
VAAPTPVTAERVIGEAFHRPDLAMALLEESPELRADPWLALTLGDASVVADARMPGGPLDRPPLFYVARSRIAADTATAARELLARGADPNGPGGEEWTNLSVACARGDAPLAGVLLDAGAEPNDNDSLYHAMEPAADDCARLLLDHGAIERGTNALAHALDYERIGRVRLLLERGADAGQYLDWPALHHAVARGRSAEFLQVLVAHGADPARRDASGRTAYQVAVRRGREDLAETLRSLGAPDGLAPDDLALRAVAKGEAPPPFELDDDARDMLIELAMRDLDGLGRVVDAVGPRFGARWGGGPRGTLLHQASWIGRPDFVELLLGRGAEVDEPVETEYATPLGWAAVGSRYSPAHPHDTFSFPDADHVAVARLLVAAGARIEPKFVEMAVPPLSDWLALH